MNSFKNRTVAATAAIFATLVTVAAATPVRAETNAVSVSYADLDMSSAAGSHAFAARVNRAAATVCGDHVNANRITVASCRQDAISTAQKKARASVRIASR